MFESIYTGKTGLLAFSKGLDVLSNNIANLNTPGFKSAELAFRDLFLRYTTTGGGNEETPMQIGSGVDTPATTLRFRQGELRETGNALDAAIDGNGFFVLRDEGKYTYTRAGQFEFDADGNLVERTSGFHLMGLQGTGLVDIKLDGRRSNAPKATSEVIFNGYLVQSTGSQVLQNVAVYDTHGAVHQLTLNFTRDINVTNGSAWTVEVREPSVNATQVIASGVIRFEGNGAPTQGANTMAFTYSPGNGVPTSNIIFNFGEPGSFSGVVSYASGGADLKVAVVSQDGYAAGSLTKTTMDEQGYLKFTYSNGQTVAGERLALAWFQDLQNLTVEGSGMFQNNGDEKPVIQGAGDDIMGKIVAGKIELSNVDLTEQFTDMVIIQRGYQASSQVTSVANEMIQQLLEINRRG